MYYFTVGIKRAKYQFSTQSKKLKRRIVIEGLESIWTQYTQQNIRTATNIQLKYKASGVPIQDFIYGMGGGGFGVMEYNSTLAYMKFRWLLTYHFTY